MKPYKKTPQTSNLKPHSGLTLIEILISIALIVIIMSVYFLVANPAGQLASSRNTTRRLNLQTIMLAVQQNRADNNETFSCSSGALPTTTTNMASASGYNIAPCLSDVLSVMPFDPSASSSYFNSVNDYNTGYTIVQNVASNTITLAAPNVELKQTISITR